jgi:hypothetical protein
MIEGNYKYEESRIQDLYMVLKKGGFNVYFPSTKMGECLSPYVVVKNDGLTKHVEFSTNLSLYSVLCYVPRDSYSKLESYKNKVKEKTTMAEVSRAIKFQELVEVRKEEMESMLPGLYTTVEMDGRSARVYSKSAGLGGEAPKFVKGKKNKQ